VSYIAYRHEILRTTFAEDNGEPVQRMDPPQLLELPLLDFSLLPDDVLRDPAGGVHGTAVERDWRRGCAPERLRHEGQKHMVIDGRDPLVS
jgi:hypothetical protein